jgi:hypothetical protein
MKDLSDKYIINRNKKSKCKKAKTPNELLECGHIMTIFEGKKKCEKLDSSPKKLYACYLEVFWKLEKYVKFIDLRNLLGPDNIFVSASISGFRENSETLFTPIRSNTLGKVSSRFPYGPVEMIKNIIGISSGEFEGSWIRENL